MWTVEQELMAAVLEQAIEDLYCHPNAVENSIYFFLSEDNCEGSFLRICEVLGISPNAVRKHHEERINYCIRYKSKSRPLTRKRRPAMADYISMFKKPEVKD